MFTWRDVFDPKLPYNKIEQVMKLVQLTGYRFFAWQGSVWKIVDTDEGTRAERVGSVGDVS